MYKRRFTTPLHKPPATTNDGATAPATNDAESAKQQAQQLIASLRAGGLKLDNNKENSVPAHASDSAAAAAKKPRLFAAPAPSQTATTRPPPHPTAVTAAAAAKAAGFGSSSSQQGDSQPRTFAVLYCKHDKFKKKKDKGYQDGIIELRPDKTATLLDMEGKVVTKGKPKLPKVLESGAIVELGNFCCEYDQEVPLDDFKRGTCFFDHSKPAASSSIPSSSSSNAPKPASGAFKPLKQQSAGLPGAGGPRRGLQTSNTSASGGPLTSSQPAQGFFDPTAPGAVVVNACQWQEGKGFLPTGRPVVPVVIDPYLGRHLRPHQREGVTFMYECVMGLRSSEHSGCLLADEMGLGKTLQVLALLWTLLRQGPEGTPVVRKAIVVAPATLVENWGKEVKKWLGQERLRYIQLAQGPSAAEEISNFKLGTVWKLLIASYESMRKFGPELAGCCNLLICDEGHRLKAKGGNKTIDSLLSLSCPKRVVLTGTPVQNNLSEFYALMSFAVPGLLGTFSTFNAVYGDIITRSRDKAATAEDKKLGAIRAEELQKRVSGHMLRRTQEVLQKHLPPLAVHTMFCKPSALQVEVYRCLLRSKRITSLLYGVGGSSSDSEGVLPAITVLRKLCNHPKLLQVDGTSTEQQEQSSMKMAELAGSILQQQLSAAGLSIDAVELSGKLQTLSALLSGIIAEQCKVVVVSTSTSALDLVDSMLCVPHGWKSVRIDGSVNVNERQTVVDNFNTRGIGQVFLLSTRAGGAGLNLIGANHLVLFDCDWNPAADLQAMSRIWRDGQKKPCFVTRLVTAGTIEEKVYQRQMMKSDLADATMHHGGGSTNRLSHDELKQLFHLDLSGECSTRKLLDASSAGNNLVWLQLPGADGSGGGTEGSSSLSLPNALAAAVAAGSVTTVNWERQGSEVAECTEAAAASAPEGRKGMDVEALEVDDDW